MANKRKEKTKEERIKKELNKLQIIFGIKKKTGKKSENNSPILDEKTQKTIEGLIENAAFMRVELQDLVIDIRDNGLTEKFTQSDKIEPYDRIRPNADLYNKLNVNYQKIIKQLTDFLPQKNKAESLADDFDDFVDGRKDM